LRSVIAIGDLVPAAEKIDLSGLVPKSVSNGAEQRSLACVVLPGNCCVKTAKAYFDVLKGAKVLYVQ
jgi:hypothetical protein